ncbi:MAG: hypothetical protein OXI24_13445 [Candidatus Poribacteria bacterium]|nr:hypothetical protein [Candidatus Poribacteria bacterium]
MAVNDYLLRLHEYPELAYPVLSNFIKSQQPLMKLGILGWQAESYDFIWSSESFRREDHGPEMLPVPVVLIICGFISRKTKRAKQVYPTPNRDRSTASKSLSLRGAILEAKSDSPAPTLSHSRQTEKNGFTKQKLVQKLELDSIILSWD